MRKVLYANIGIVFNTSKFYELNVKLNWVLDGKAYVVKINRLTEISAAKLPPYLSLLIDVTD